MAVKVSWLPRLAIAAVFHLHLPKGPVAGDGIETALAVAETHFLDL